MGLEVPIALCVFNRPQLTQKVFASIREQQPHQLLLIGDGPRAEVAGEAALVEEVQTIVQQVDWDCEVKTNFAKTNLGCKNRMASGLSWAFEQAEQLIVLEDDCLPHPSFFSYCQQLLERFWSDPNVMMISGDHFQPSPTSANSYYFSHWAHIWGWASWRSAWQHYDLELSDWPSIREQNSFEFDSVAEQHHWSDIFDQVHARLIDTWDFSWQYSIFKNDGLVVLPETNLISNIGFGPDATHTTQMESTLANLATTSIAESGNLIHPKVVARNKEADQWTFENIFSRPIEMVTPEKKSWWQRVLNVA